MVYENYVPPFYTSFMLSVSLEKMISFLKAMREKRLELN
jgi:hypothetical protein